MLKLESTSMILWYISFWRQMTLFYLNWCNEFVEPCSAFYSQQCVTCHLSWLQTFFSSRLQTGTLFLQYSILKKILDISATQMLSLTSDFIKVSIYTINVQFKFKYFRKVLIQVLWEVTGHWHPEKSVQYKIGLLNIYFFICAVLKRYFSLVDRFSTKLIQFATCCEFLLLLL